MRATLAILLGILASASAGEILPKHLPSMPALIQIPVAGGNACGTGIFLTGERSIFLVTAKHVIFDLAHGREADLIGSGAVISTYVQGVDHEHCAVVLANLNQLRQRGMIKPHPTHDVVVLRLGAAKPPHMVNWENGAYQTNDIASGLNFYDLAGCRLLADVLDGNDIYILGYPVELLNTNLNSEVDFSQILCHSTSSLVITQFRIRRSDLYHESKSRRA